MSTYPDEFDKLHKALVADAKRQPEYASNTETALHGYSEGVEHALDTIRRAGIRLPVTDPYAPSFGKPVSAWFRWFAWRPVETVDRGVVWLRMVNRRRIHKHQHLHGGADWWFQHAVDVRPQL